MLFFKQKTSFFLINFTRIAATNIYWDLKVYPAFRCVEIIATSTQDSIIHKDAEASVL